MAKINAKTIPVKCLLSADDFLLFDQACDGEPHSSVLRNLAKKFSRRRTHITAPPPTRERPQKARNMAMFCPGRAGVTSVHRRP